MTFGAANAGISLSLSMIFFSSSLVFADSTSVGFVKTDSTLRSSGYVKVCGATDQDGPICTSQTNVGTSALFDTTVDGVVRPELMVVEGKCSANFWSAEDRGKMLVETLSDSTGSIVEDIGFVPGTYRLECLETNHRDGDGHLKHKNTIGLQSE